MIARSVRSSDLNRSIDLRHSRIRPAQFSAVSLIGSALCVGLKALRRDRESEKYRRFPFLSRKQSLNQTSMRLRARGRYRWPLQRDHYFVDKNRDRLRTQRKTEKNNRRSMAV